MRAKDVFKQLFPATFKIGPRKYKSINIVLSQPYHIFKEDYEPWFDDVFRAALEGNDGAVIDVGVNMMQTLLKVLALDPSREYIGFEPQTKAVLMAKEFCRQNGLENVTIVSAALSERAGVLELKLSSDTGMDSSASTSNIRSEDFYSHSDHIPVLVGDDAIADLGPDSIAMINADVEGAELEVLIGLEKTIRRFKPVILFEVLNDWNDPTGDREMTKVSQTRNARARELTELIHGFDYQILAVRKEGLIPIVAIDRLVSNDLSLCNYVAISNESSRASEAFRALIA